MRRATSVPPELPGYTFVRLLGSGGFSDVFLYDQHLPKRRVAVKVLLTEELTPAHRAAFVAEANLMAQLSAHPYIVSIFHADVASDDRPYFVMEYCPGPSLAERYKSETMSVADVMRTGVRVAGAIGTAHAAGILHRDIKPANILTNDFGWPALTDFGISSAMDDELPVHTTTLSPSIADTGGTTGSASIGMSVPWSPPEMFIDDPKPDVRADVFSLAATLYTLLAGHTPFEIRGRSNGTLDLIGRIERGMITPLTREDVPRSLIAVLNKGMASDREERFATPVDLARALQRVELELGYAPTTIDVPNLIVDRSVRGDSNDEEDATRVRSVATIEAQPAAPAIPAVPTQKSAIPESTVLGSSRAADTEAPAETVMRSRVAQPVESASPPPPVGPPRPGQAPPGQKTPGQMTPGQMAPGQPAPEASAPVSRARRTVLWAAAAAVVVIAAGVVAGVLVYGTPGPDPITKPSNSGGSNGGGGAAVVETVPTPTLDGVEPSGSNLVFAIGNPKPKEGDVMIWKRLDRGSEAPRQKVVDGAFTVADYTGATVCVEVKISRAGRESANPLEVCYPE